MSAPPHSRNRLRRRYRGTYRRWLVAFENTWTGRGGRSLSLSLNHHILSGLLHRGSSISISTLLNGLLQRGSSISTTTPLNSPLYRGSSISISTPLNRFLHRGSSISITTLLNRLLQRGSSISTTTPLNSPLYRGSSISITTLLNRLLHRGSSISTTTPLIWPLYRGSSISITTPSNRFLHRGSFYSAIDTGFLLGEMIVLNHIDQRPMDLDATVVFDKAELAKAIHEETDTGAGGANHLCQSLLRDGRDEGFRFTRLTKFSQQQENPGQTFFAVVEKLIDKVGLGSHAPGQEEFHIHFGEGALLVHHADHLLPSYLQRCTKDDGRGSGQVQPTDAGERLLSNEFTGGEERDRGLLAVR